MTVIACATIITIGALLGLAICTSAWERVQVKRTDNFVAVNRDGLAAQRNIIRDQTRHQDQQ